MLLPWSIPVMQWQWPGSVDISEETMFSVGNKRCEGALQVVEELARDRAREACHRSKDQWSGANPDCDHDDQRNGEYQET